MSDTLQQQTFGTLDVYFVRHGESENNVLQARLRREKGLEGSHDAFLQHRLHDPDLTDLGRRQAELVAARMKTECPGVSTIWVSYLSRALGTAAAIHEALPHATVWVMRDINEVGGSYRYDAETKKFVAVPGSSPRVVKRHYPRFQIFDHSADVPPLPLSEAQWAAIGDGEGPAGVDDEDKDDDSGWYTLEGKEPPDHAKGRAQRLIERLDAAARQVPVGVTVAIAVVTHGDLFKLLSNILLHTKLAGDAQAREAIQGRQQGCASAGALDTWIHNTSVTVVRLSEASTTTDAMRRAAEVNDTDGRTRTTGEPLQNGVATAAVEWKLILFADHAHLTAAGAEATP